MENELSTFHEWKWLLLERYCNFTGIFLHESGLLGASPDGINEDSTLEIKCVYSHRQSTDLRVALQMPRRKSDRYVVNFYEKEKAWVINKDHEYYHQVQGQLYLSNRTVGYFYVWAPRSQAAFRFQKDPDWGENLNLLIDFYVNRFLPFVLLHADLIPTRNYAWCMYEI